MRKFLALWFLMIFLAGCGMQKPTTHLPAPLPTPKPTFNLSESVQLLPWTAETADRLIRNLRQENLDSQIPDTSTQEALLLALQEALWSFPHAPQAFTWQWWQVSYQARTGNSEAAKAFAPLIAASLTSGETTLESLPDWLSAREPQGTFVIEAFTAAPGQSYAGLLYFSLGGQPAYFWLTRSETAYQVSLLGSGSEFKPLSTPQVQLEWHDLTGDGLAEAWLIQSNNSPRIEMFSLTLYNLASGAAQRLAFTPALPLLPAESWQIVEEEGHPSGLRVEVRVDDGSALCEYPLPVMYHLEGNAYRITSIERPVLAELVSAGLSEAQARLCMDLSVDWLRALASRGDGLALALLEALLPGFPYGADATLYVGLYPLDEKDRARFELGLNYARLGDPAGVQRWMLAVLNQPVDESSPWRGKAQAFLEAYLPDSNLRRACQASQACLGTGRLDMRALLALMQPQDWENPIAFLRQSGLAIAQSGQQDFNQDGILETWWVEGDTFNITALFQDVPWMSRLSLPDDGAPLVLEPITPLLEMPVYSARRGTEEMFFLYIQPDPAQAPTLWTLDTYRAYLVQSLYQSLLQDGEATSVSASLRELQMSPYFDCQQPTERCQPSAQLAYMRALLLEQTGAAEAAAQAFLHLAEAFPESGFAVLGRARVAP